MWQIITGIGICCLILEIFVPSLFFLNFAIAAFICAIISVFYQSIIGLLVIFCILSLVLIAGIRPIFLNGKKNKDLQTGMEGKYIGKTARAVENIDKNNGIITIYDERWQARNIEDGTIEAGQTVEITGYDSIIMQVKKVN